MPKRVIDFDAMWASDKLAGCPAWAQAEYAWLYGLADSNGSFELTNLRVIWGKVAAIRKDLALARLEQIFDEFRARGLLFTWEENGKRYGHWTNSDQPGRLPPPSWRARLERLAPPVPQAALAAYVQQFARGASREPSAPRSSPSLGPGKDSLEATQGQEKERELEKEGEREKGKIVHGRESRVESQGGDAAFAYQGSSLRITARQDSAMAEAFPWVERQAEYRKMNAWLEANPARRPHNLARFAHNWLSKIPRFGGTAFASAQGKSAPLVETRVGAGPAAGVRVKAAYFERLQQRLAEAAPQGLKS